MGLHKQQAEAMVPRSKIIKQSTYLTYECSKDPKTGKYYHTLMLEDEEGEHYMFRSTYTFKHDESGKARFSLDNVKTADFRSNRDE